MLVLLLLLLLLLHCGSSIAACIVHDGSKGFPQAAGQVRIGLSQPRSFHSLERSWNVGACLQISRPPHPPLLEEHCVWRQRQTQIEAEQAKRKKGDERREEAQEEKTVTRRQLIYRNTTGQGRT